MNIQVISAVAADDGTVRARLRVDSVKRCGDEPEMKMRVSMRLAAVDGRTPQQPLSERVYDEMLRYLDID